MYIPGLINASTYPFYSQESIGGGRYPDFAAVNEALNQVQPNRVMRFGEYVVDKDGNAGQYVKTVTGNTDVVAGNVLMKAATIVGTVSTADATGDGIHVLKTNLAGLTLNSEAGNYAFIEGYGIYKILANSATVSSVAYITISKKDTRFARGGYDGNAIAAGVPNTTKIIIDRRYDMDLCTAGSTPTGVAVGALSANAAAKAGLVLVQGYGQVLAAGSGTTITAGGVIVCTATGLVTGPTATETTAENRSFVGVSRFGYTPASSGELIMANVLLWGRW